MSEQKSPLTKYVSGEDRFINFAEDVLGLELLDIQKEIMRAVANHKRVVVCSGNGVGKTYTVAALELAFLYTHSESMVLHTSRSNGHIRNTVYKELREMHEVANERGFPLHGTVKKTPMEIDFEDSQTRKYEAMSPSNPDGLEGRHSENFLTVVDEADKPEVTGDVIESAESSLTDDNDRIVAIGNPPRDKSNSIHSLMESDYWHTIQFSSFDCDNVLIQAGKKDGEIISGPIQLSEIKRDWDKHHDEEWPGFEEARNSGEREDLAEAWYRRRLGIIPPKSAAQNRPFYSSDVADAEERWTKVSDSRPAPSDYDAIAVDVAGRGQDSTVVAGVTTPSDDDEVGRADVLGEYDRDTEQGNEKAIREAIRGAEETPVVFDTAGMGGPVADTFRNEGYEVVRFDGNKKARNSERYYNMRTEGFDELGNWLRHNTIKPESELTKELYGTSEVIALNEKSLRSGTSFIATSKDEIKKAKNYGESPDFLDAVAMAVWGSNHSGSFGEASWTIYTESYGGNV